MNNTPQSFSTLLLVILTTLITPHICKANNYLLNCGAQNTTFDNQIWHTDEDPAFVPPSAYKAATTGAPATIQDPYSADQVPCRAARTFHAPFTYSFPVSHGPKFLRLHFCGYGTYDNILGEQFFLTVQANGGLGSFTLLHNFSAYLHQKQFINTYRGYITREFLVMATSSRLNLTFAPTIDGSMGFVNGIEIVDVPDGLYDYLSPQSIEDSDINTTSSSRICIRKSRDPTSFSRLGPAALETVARLNVGGGDVSPEEDSRNMSRTWYTDEDHLIHNFNGAIPNRIPMKIHYTESVPVYTAPSMVYWTARLMGPYTDTIKLKNNLTWIFTVDSGFDYLVRLHFCEIVKEVKKSGQREFDVFFNDQIAQIGFDVMNLTNDRRGTPVCLDSLTPIYGTSGVTTSTKVYLSLTLRPTFETNPLYHDVILNGIEIFKLNQSNGNLAGPQPEDPNQSNRPGPSKKLMIILIAIAVSVVGAVIVVVALLYFTRRLGLANVNILSKSDRINIKEVEASVLKRCGEHTPKRYTFGEIKQITSCFKEKLGEGGYGGVYKGKLQNGSPVAVKLLNNPNPNHDGTGFTNELSSISETNHVNVVALLGYCFQGRRKALVYEFMPNGSLDKYLYSGKIQNLLPWETLHQIAIGIGRGLEYLHKGCRTRILHFDIKPHNILLDAKFCPKISDFGLAKPCLQTKSLMTMSATRGTPGYIAPEVFCRGFGGASHKSDVYSYRMLVLDLVGCRKNNIAVSDTTSGEM